MIFLVGIYNARSSGNLSGIGVLDSERKRSYSHYLSRYFRATMRRQSPFLLVPPPFSLSLSLSLSLSALSLSPFQHLTFIPSVRPSVRPSGNEIGAAPDYPASFHIAVYPLIHLPLRNDVEYVPHVCIRMCGICWYLYEEVFSI